jgi:hypothetical protein
VDKVFCVNEAGVIELKESLVGYVDVGFPDTVPGAQASTYCFRFEIVSFLEQMLQAEDSYSGRYGGSGSEGSDLEEHSASFLEFSTPVEQDDGRVVFGCLFIAIEDLSFVVLAHELLHAALSFERKVVGFKGSYMDYSDNNVDEERLADTQQVFLAAVGEYFSDLDLKIPLVCR